MPIEGPILHLLDQKRSKITKDNTTKHVVMIALQIPHRGKIAVRLQYLESYAIPTISVISRLQSLMATQHNQESFCH